MLVGIPLGIALSFLPLFIKAGVKYADRLFAHSLGRRLR